MEDQDSCSQANLCCVVFSEAQIRILKAKLRIMQEELDGLSYDYNKKVSHLHSGRLADTFIQYFNTYFNNLSKEGEQYQSVQ